MTSYNELSQNRSRFLSMTGYTVEAFQALLPHVQAEFEKYVEEFRLDGKPRTRRKYSDYRNSPLPTIEDKLLFILIYLKQGTIQQSHATLFGMYQPDVNKWVQLLEPLLRQALAALRKRAVREAEAVELMEQA